MFRFEVEREEGNASALVGVQTGVGRETPHVPEGFLRTIPAATTTSLSLAAFERGEAEQKARKEAQ